MMDKIKALVSNNKLLYFLLAIFSLLLACLLKDYDYDLYARLIVGEHFFSTGWISYKDFLSYTPTHTWYDHEWGASLIFYQFLKLFGPFGLILVQAITVFVTTVFVIKTQRLQPHSYPTSLFFIMFFMLLFYHQNPSIVRCHLFSFMFFSILLYILEKTRKQNSKLIWIIPIMILIWNNIHGGVVSGLGIIFIYMFCEFISGKMCKKYFLVLLISTPLLVINPYGFEYLDFLFSANTKNRMHITEWWDVFAKRHAIYYFPLYLAGVFSFVIYLLNIVRKKKFDLTKFSVLLVTLVLGILHVKLLSLTIITVAALFYNDIISLFDKKMFRALNKLALFFIACSILYLPFTEPALARTDMEKFPVQEVEFLKQNKIKGNILSLFGLGSYVSYKLYPQNLIYMDGRYEEVYYDNEFENLKNYEICDVHNWSKVLTDYPSEILMPVIESDIYKKLKMNLDWEEVYQGQLCAIFLKKNRLNYKGPFVYPPKDLAYYQANEFDKIGNFGKQ